MSSYITRWCAKHGDWDEDVDNPEEACPECIAQGWFITRKKLLQENAELKRQLAEKDQQLIELDHCREAAGKVEDMERQLAAASQENSDE